MKLGLALLVAALALPLAAEAATPGAGPPLARMQEHMDRMQQTMSELHAAKTAKQRDALLQTHMQQMMAAMTTMGETMGGGMSAGAGQGMMGNGGMMGGHGMMGSGGTAGAPPASPGENAPGAGNPPDRLQAQIDQLTTRQDMLQQMLEQMLQQQEAMMKR